MSDSLLWAGLVGCVGGVAVTFAGFAITQRISQNDKIRHLRKVLSSAHRTIQDQKKLVRDISMEWEEALRLYYFMRTEGMNVLSAASQYLKNKPVQFGDHECPVVLSEVERIRQLFETTLPREAQPTEDKHGDEAAAHQERSIN